MTIRSSRNAVSLGDEERAGSIAVTPDQQARGRQLETVDASTVSESMITVGAWRGPSVGTLIQDTYRIVGQLGQGGMGTVMLALDEKLQRDVAIKFIRPDLVASRETQDRFLSEARMMAKIKHANVAEIYAFGHAGGSPYFVMEYVPGGTLADWLDDAVDASRPRSVADALNLLDQICRGVHAIHQRGATHGDLKPCNILLGTAGRVAIADMGLARVWEDDAKPPLAAGTPAYMAPDIFRSDLPGHLTSRGDVYALGVIAFELLTGAKPWPVRSMMDMFTLHSVAPPAPLPSSVRPALTRAFDQPLLKALSWNLEERTESAEAFRIELLKAAESLTEDYAGERILVADDDEDFRLLAQETLAFAFPGAEIEVVHDGLQALRACQRGPASLAVVDLDMPGLNGVELTAMLRAESDVPVVVVTACGGAPDWKLLSALGAAGFLVKPIDPYALVTLARKALRRRQAKQ